MIVMKFGGTSLQNAESIRPVVGIEKRHHVLILVAADGTSDTSVSFVVPPESVDSVAMEFHRNFFGQDVPDRVFVPTEQSARS